MGVCPHNPMGPVAGAVALQFDVATPNFVIQEEAVGIVPWFEEVCATYPLHLEDGAWCVAGGARPRNRDRRDRRRAASLRAGTDPGARRHFAGRPDRELVKDVVGPICPV